MNEYVPVKFLKPWQQYNGGEIAGFPPPVARMLVMEKYAEPFVERASVTKVPAPITKDATDSKPAKKKTKKRVTKKKA